jgi:glycopeptide antibiotics resistance protein
VNFLRLEFGISEWLIGIAILIVLLPILWRQSHSPWHFFCFTIFWMYLLVLVSVTIFPIPLRVGDAGFRFDSVWEQVAHMQRFHGINLIPFYFDTCWDLPRPCAIGIYQNILMTVPFGFGISFIARVKPRDLPWLAVGLGLAIEIAQFALDLAMGGSYRTVDVNDVLFNAMGVLLGYGMFRVFAWLYLTITNHFRIIPKGLPAYIYDVASQTQTVELTNPEQM